MMQLQPTIKRAFSFLTIAALLAPISVLAQTTATATAAKTPDPIANCKAFAALFFGLFDWVLARPQFCTASGFLLFLINTALVFAGGVAVLFLVLGGFRYLTSNGDAEAAEKGRGTLTNAVIGLVVILMASAIVRIVSGTITGGGAGGAGGGGGVVGSGGGSTATTADLVKAFTVQTTDPAVVVAQKVFRVQVNFDAAQFPGGASAANAALTQACGGGAPVVKLSIVGKGATPGTPLSGGSAQMSIGESAYGSIPFTAEVKLCDIILQTKEIK